MVAEKREQFQELEVEFNFAHGQHTQSAAARVQRELENTREEKTRSAMAVRAQCFIIYNESHCYLTGLMSGFRKRLR